MRGNLHGHPCRVRAMTLAFMLVGMFLAGVTQATTYFPGADNFNEEWYGGQLKALRERPLCCVQLSAARVVRFLWLRSFHHPVVIRLNELPDGRWRMTVKIGSGAGGYAPRRQLRESQHICRADEVATVLALFDPKSPFWSMPSDEPVSTDGAIEEVHVDGAQWIVEARDNTRYHWVDRFSPESGPIREFGMHLMTLSRQKLGPIY